MGLKRGTFVIMNDSDCPEAKMVAVLTRYDDKLGIWHALYLSPMTNMKAPYGPNPTPLHQFGKCVDVGNGEYQICDTKQVSTAKYYDGKIELNRSGSPPEIVYCQHGEHLMK